MRLARSACIGLLVIAFALGIGMVGYRAFEPMSWVDAFVNAAMILSGMGPVSSLQTDGGKIFAGCYALFSGLAFLTSLGIILHRPSTASSTSFISKKRSARTKWAGDTSSLIWQGRAAARPSIMAAQQRRPTFASFLFCAWPATRYSSFMLWAYTKYHALGNDYIVIDPKNLPSPL